MEDWRYVPIARGLKRVERATRGIRTLDLLISCPGAGASGIQVSRSTGLSYGGGVVGGGESMRAPRRGPADGSGSVETVNSSHVVEWIEYIYVVQLATFGKARYRMETRFSCVFGR